MRISCLFLLVTMVEERRFRRLTLPDKTLVVLSVPIHYDRNWLVINKGLCIVDCKTGDEYPVLEEAHGIEMNKLLWVEGCQGRSVLLTLVFPKLPKRVKND